MTDAITSFIPATAGNAQLTAARVQEESKMTNQDTETRMWVSCHMHGLAANKDCSECKIAFDVNLSQHSQGTCIPERCPFHEA